MNLTESQRHDLALKIYQITWTATCHEARNCQSSIMSTAAGLMGAILEGPPTDSTCLFVPSPHDPYNPKGHIKRHFVRLLRKENLPTKVWPYIRLGGGNNELLPERISTILLEKGALSPSDRKKFPEAIHWVEVLNLEPI